MVQKINHRYLRLTRSTGHLHRLTLNETDGTICKRLEAGKGKAKLLEFTRSSLGESLVDLTLDVFFREGIEVDGDNF
jgi:hypothetical protein